ncbi:type II and III secretion system protein family protein [Photobacterium halotolerans]|uniref:type II and III secretion system protein family protein n=1 Tax=Photobacterium halotolerans TaxID=265726 RepID=UPI001372C9F3|nr:type II and III secretion system protein family protein [Photobacterium halotolerans]NAW86482.1 type II and III secretion system protein [Photobacterium halotolerans]
MLRFVNGFCVFLALSLSVSVDARDFQMDVGQQVTVHSGKRIQRAAIGEPSVAGVKVLSTSELLVTGKQTGSTSLLIWERGSEEPVRHRISVNPGGVATSNIQVQTDIKVVEVSKSALKEAGFFFGKQGSGGTFWGIGNASAITGASFNGFRGSFLSSGDAFNLVIGNVADHFLGTISALDSNGFAYTLAEPSLVTMSGHTATFLAGGEFPYPKSTSDDDISIEFKEFGVRLNLTPTVMSGDRIMLKVAPEVSELNYAQGVQASGVIVPGLSVRRTDTTVQLGNGESFVISGLVSRSTIKNANRFPGLGDIPILGAFFRSTRLEENDKELMMVVTPHLVKPFASNAPLPPLPGEMYRQFKPNFFELIFLDAEPRELPVKMGFSGEG